MKRNFSTDLNDRTLKLGNLLTKAPRVYEITQIYSPGECNVITHFTRIIPVCESAKFQKRLNYPGYLCSLVSPTCLTRALEDDTASGPSQLRRRTRRHIHRQRARSSLRRRAGISRERARAAIHATRSDRE